MPTNLYVILKIFLIGDRIKLYLEKTTFVTKNALNPLFFIKNNNYCA